ncbi:hypothetical protein VNO78_18467 [Psophocarpus tetragonolobus]|uniref:TF-B3 domain-containing protein n=1 Tax=Psophocarpus tetragonolobus TaxID=3891 RepID=A0AAN9SIH6_PSOTE
MESAKPFFGDKTLQEFFKVFLLQNGSTQLQIPTSFTKFFNGVTPCRATLVDEDRKSWDVSMERIEGRLVFKNGWQQFARDKDLEEGDFLVFQYDGSSTFNVKIFSKTGCRKVAAPATPRSGKIVPTAILDEDPNQRCTKIQRGRKRKQSSPSLQTNDKSEMEGTCSSKGVRCKSETFDAPWKLKKVELPRRVLKKRNIKLISNISLRDEDGKIWPASITTTDNENRYFLGSGWVNFRRSNNIQEGHQCDFEFVVDKENVAQELLVRVRSKCSLRWVDCK